MGRFDDDGYPIDGSGCATRQPAGGVVSTEPQITDKLGRVWTRAPGRSGDLYRHDDMTWPRAMVERPEVGWPGAAAFDNPNYTWCDTCLAHRGGR